MKKLVGTYIFLLLNLYLFPQTWEENIFEKNKNATFFDLKESFNNYRDSIPYTKGNGYNPYARKIDFLEPRVNEEGFFPSHVLLVY